jgi:hypothetical protein
MKPILDQAKQEEICRIIALGGTRALAARAVGCTERTIRNTARRDPNFRRMLRTNEVSPELKLLTTLVSAGTAGDHLPVTKWALERIYPQRYGWRHAHSFGLEQLREVVEQLIQIIGQHIPDAKTRAAIRRKILRLVSRQRLTPLGDRHVINKR